MSKEKKKKKAVKKVKKSENVDKKEKSSAARREAAETFLKQRTEILQNALERTGNAEQFIEDAGVKEISNLIGVDLSTGVKDKKQANELREKYGENKLPPKRVKAFYEFILDGIEDRIMLLLIFAAFLQIILAIAFGESPEWEWMEGAAILVAVTIVVLVTAVNDFLKEKKFRDIEAVKEDRVVSVVRNGKEVSVKHFELVVGDVLKITAGDLITADAVLFEAADVKLDESSFTGETADVKKSAKHHAKADKFDPFLFSGTHVMMGSGRALVVAVGVDSQFGKLQMALRETLRAPSKKKKKSTSIDEDEDNNTSTPREKPLESKENDENNDDDDEEESELKWPHNKRWLCLPRYPDQSDEATPLQERLQKLAVQIGYLGLAAALLTIIALLIQWGVGKAQDGNVFLPADSGTIVSIIVIGLTILVVAVPEGLPLAVTIALAYSMQKMLRDNNLVRHLAACETMGSATDICSDKTGTLTLNRMTVVRVCVGASKDTLDVEEAKDDDKTLNDAIGQDNIVGIEHNISLNSTASTAMVNDQLELSGSKTECALLLLQGKHLTRAYDVVRKDDGDNVLKVFPFNSTIKYSAILIRTKKNKAIYYVKGASEVVLAKCTSSISNDGIKSMKKKTRKRLEDVVEEMASSALRTLCLAYKEVEVDPNVDEDDIEEPSFDELTLQIIVGIKDPIRPEVPDAVHDCQNAGIVVRMVTGDNLATAKAIAKECDILTEGGVAMTGPEFRKLEDEEVDKLLIPQYDKDNKPINVLQVIARCSPADKQRLVRRLRLANRVVASTGDGTNDAPQLKLADVGFAMGITGTEVAKEASDIILMDDNFASIVQAVMWGRNVFDSVRKFLQFQLTVNVVALVTAFVSSIYLGFSALTAVQLLWINLVMDTLGALALATDPPVRDELLSRKPAGRHAPLISRSMWRFIIGHSLFQCALLLMLLVFFKEQVDHNIWFFEGADVPPPPCELASTGCVCLDTCTSALDVCLPEARDDSVSWCVRRASFPALDSDAAQMVDTAMNMTLDAIDSAINAAGSVCESECAAEYDECHSAGFLAPLPSDAVCLQRYSGKEPPSHGQTIVFNTFVWMQVFNEFNARILHSHFSPLHGLGSNYIFIAVIVIIAVVQALMTIFGGRFFGTISLTGREWLGCLVFAVLVIPFGAFLRLIPVRNTDYDEVVEERKDVEMV